MTYPETWPDGTRKSMGNAFNWRENSLGILTARPMPVSPRSQDMHSNDQNYAYTKAKATPRAASQLDRGKLFTINKEKP